MAKVLLFSDLHLHNWSYGATQERGWNSRLLVQKKFLEDLREVVVKENIHHVFFLGDLFHEHGVLRADVIEVAYNGFKDISAAASGKCVALVGNHDFLTRNGGIHSLTFMEGTGWDIAFPEMSFENFRFLSFISEKNLFYDMLRMKDFEFGFFHQGSLGVPMASGFELPDEILRTTELPTESLCFSGHYHRRQKVSDNLVMVGSPMQHTWGDSGDDRGYIILDTDTKEYKFINYNGPKFVNVEVDGSTQYGDAEKIENNYIRLYGDVPLQILEDARVYVMDHGARSCEIVPKVKAVPDFQQRPTLSIQDAIKLYEKEALLSAKEIEVGETLRNGLYRGKNKQTIH